MMKNMLPVFWMYSKNQYIEGIPEVWQQLRDWKNANLKMLLDEQIKVTNGTVQYTFDEKRLCRILIKLAKGHAGFELDYISFDDSDIQIDYDFVFNMSEADIDRFEEIPQTNLFQKWDREAV